MILCNLLLNHKADPNFKDKGSATPLHKAAWNGCTAVANLLLKHKADPSILDADGQTAAQGAREPNQQQEAVEVREQRALSFEAKKKVSEMLEAAQRGDLAVVEDSLSHCPVDACIEPYRRTCLHWAAEIGHETLCRLLLSRKADPNFADRDNATPLHKAFSPQCPETAVSLTLLRRLGMTTLPWRSSCSNIARTRPRSMVKDKTPQCQPILDP